MRKQQRQAGFSLIELLIVVGIIGIISAIAIPNLLSSRRAANEGSALSSLRIVFSAQATYQSTIGTGAFSTDLAGLNNSHLIDNVLGGGSKSGYNFAVVDASGSGATARFGATAVPSVTTGVTQTGTRRFALTQDGLLRADTTLTPLTTVAEIDVLPPLSR